MPVADGRGLSVVPGHPDDMSHVSATETEVPVNRGDLVFLYMMAMKYRGAVIDPEYRDEPAGLTMAMEIVR
jgi:hypothetical protein